MISKATNANVRKYGATSKGSFLTAMVAAAGIGCGLAAMGAVPGRAQAAMNLATSHDLAVAQELSHAYEQLHHAIKNSVVNISVIKVIHQAAPQFHIQMPPGFGNMLPPGAFPLVPGQGGGGVEKLMGTGSGVIISSDGYIVTNNHVVSDATHIRVTLADGRHFKATIVGRDPKTDLAVIKISASNLDAATLGDSAKVRVGEWVIAIGSPFNFKQTMTHGIISATGRTNVNIIADNDQKLRGLTYEDYLQTDAAINPGNSGGPLVNLRGHVIGINSAIATNTGSFNGIGFAIPSNEVKAISHALIKYGKVVRGYLGVTIADLRHAEVRKVAGTFGFKGRHGVLINQVEPGSPAASGGLKRGDIIVAMNGHKVMNINVLRDEIANTHPGKDVHLSIFRNGKDISLTFPVGTQPATRTMTAMAGGNGGGQTMAQSPTLGLTVSAVPAPLAKKYGLAAPKGVLITGVKGNSVAAGVGISPGDLLLSIQGHPVNSPDEFSTVIHKVNLGAGVRMTLRSPDGSERFVFVQHSGN